MSDQELVISNPMWYKRRLIDGFWLKIIGFVFTLIDHVGLIFLQSGTLPYEILRDMGRIAMPIFVLLAVEGVYYTKDYWLYFIRLMTMGFLLDCIAFTCFYGFNMVNVEPGNIFTDLALGTMTVFFLKQKNWKSVLALIPVGISILASYSLFNTPSGFQFLINMDYNFYGQCLFVGFFLAYEGVYFFLKEEAKKQNLDERTYLEGKLRLTINIFVVVALVVISGIFQLLWDFQPLNPLVPSLDIGGMRAESWACLAGIFLMLYDGRPGIKNTWARYSLYAFYPSHLLLLWLLSLAL